MGFALKEVYSVTEELVPLWTSLVVPLPAMALGRQFNTKEFVPLSLHCSIANW